MPLGHPVPQFYVSVPEKLLKVVVTRGEIFSLKFTKYRLAAGLRPDPLGELQRSPRPPSRNWGEGCLLLWVGEGKEWEKGRKGWEGARERGGEVTGRKGEGREAKGEEGEKGKGRGGRARHVCVPINKKLPLHR